MPVVAVQSQEHLASASRLKMMTMTWPVSRCIYISSHRFVFLFSIYYYLLYWWLFTEDNPSMHRPPPRCITTFTHHHQHQHSSQKKKNTLDATPLGMEAWQELPVGFIYILLFFFYIIDDIYYYSYHNDNDFHSIRQSPRPSPNLAYGRWWWRK